MKVRALRGVCIGVEQHLAAGDTADLEAAQVTFLVGIGAVEVVPAPVVAPDPELPLDADVDVPVERNTTDNLASRKRR